MYFTCLPVLQARHVRGLHRSSARSGAGGVFVVSFTYFKLTDTRDSNKDLLCWRSLCQKPSKISFLLASCYSDKAFILMHSSVLCLWTVSCQSSKLITCWHRNVKLHLMGQGWFLLISRSKVKFTSVCWNLVCAPAWHLCSRNVKPTLSFHP